MPTTILIADLNKRQVYKRTLTPEHEKDIGGRLLGLSLYREYAGDTSNSTCSPLVFATSPTNTSNLDMLVSGRTTLVGHSPLTDYVYSSSSGGKFGRALAVKGYSALVIVGQSEQEVYIDLDEQTITRTAPEKRTIAYGASATAGCLYSSLFDGTRGVYGRGGFGKAFFDKRLQGISYTEQYPTEITAEEEAFLREQNEFLKERIFAKGLRSFQDQVEGAHFAGLLFEKNYTPVYFRDKNKGILKLIEQIKKEEWQHHGISEAVQVATAGEVEIGTGDEKRKVKGPHNQSGLILGANLGIYDLNLIYDLFDRCNIGVDTLSFGGLVGAVMDMAAQGHLTTEETDGLDCTFKTFDASKPEYDPSEENYNVAVALLRKICDPDDTSKFTTALRKGVKQFTEEYGHPEYAMQVKGLSFSAYNVIKHQELALLFAISSRGPDHFRGGGFMQMEGETSAEKVYNLERNGIICDILGIDRFTRITDNADLIKSFARMYGISVEAEEFDRLARKTMVLERIMLLESTQGDAQDDLPERIFEQMSQERVPRAEMTFRDAFEQNRSEYYTLMGFDKRGIPTASTITDTGIMTQEEAMRWYEGITGEHKWIRKQ